MTKNDRQENKNMKKFNAAIILILSAAMLFFSIGSSIAGTDYSGDHLKTLCSQKNTELCEGYLWGVLDIQQSDPEKNKNICICGRNMMCGMTAVDTKKLPIAFIQWTEKNNIKDHIYGYDLIYDKKDVMRRSARKFIDTAFSCSRENPNDFLKK